MGDKTKIAWTDATWNPTRGCSKVSEGCRNCYAMGVAARFSGKGQPYEDLARMTKHGPEWTGLVDLVDEHLKDPIRWRRPRRIFVDSMSDLFHEEIDGLTIANIWKVMRAAPRHQFQILTKRALRMREWVSAWVDGGGEILPNVWLGVSVEDQKTADQRIPLLLGTPAAIRMVSYEPALERVDFAPFFEWTDLDGERVYRGPHWIIVGGESGPKARPFDVAWARSAIAQCEAAGVACFVKQLGARPVMCAGLAWDNLLEPPAPGQEFRCGDRKGADPSEWPEELRVQEYPA